MKVNWKNNHDIDSEFKVRLWYSRNWNVFYTSTSLDGHRLPRSTATDFLLSKSYSLSVLKNHNWRCENVFTWPWSLKVLFTDSRESLNRLFICYESLGRTPDRILAPERTVILTMNKFNLDIWTWKSWILKWHNFGAFRLPQISSYSFKYILWLELFLWSP